MEPLTLQTFPRAILHIDGDAFFASCEQSRRPKLQGRPVVTGKERGIAASMSYEAKACGVTRGMRLAEIRKRCPEAVILPSDYETYSLLSKRFFAIVRRYTPDVEEYSIDECFADVTGLRRPQRMSYRQMAERIKHDLDTALGFTFSVGLAPNKVMAKIASKWQKPSGLTVIPGRELHHYLAQLPVENVWGIGHQTTALLHKHGVQTALQFARQPEAWVKQYFSKPFYQIWQELNGASIFALVTGEHETYHTIQKVKTFTPPSSNRDVVFAQLAQNVENACNALQHITGIFDVFRELRQEHIAVGGGRRKGFRLADRLIGVVLAGLQRDDGGPPQLMPDVLVGLGQLRSHPELVLPRKIERRGHTKAREIGRGLLPDAPDIPNRHLLEIHVTACNRNRPGLQSARFWDHIKCLYRHSQDHINCH